MAQHILIDTTTGIARLEETTLLAEAPLASLAPHLTIATPTIFPVLPDHTRIAAYNPETMQGTVYVESIPTVRRIAVHYDMGAQGVPTRDYQRARNNRAEFEIPLPYIYFEYGFEIIPEGADGYDRVNGQLLVQFRIDQTNAFMRPNPIRSLDDLLWPARIPNVRNSGSICWGTLRADTTSLSARIEEQTRTFWHTIFNNHLGMPTPEKYPDYTAWEADKDNIGAYLDWPEWNNGLGQRIKDRLGNQNPGTTLVEDDTIWGIAPPPEAFTVGRAREWAANLDERFRRVILEAIRQELQP